MSIVKGNNNISEIRFDLDLLKKLKDREISVMEDNEANRKEFFRLCFKFGVCPVCHLDSVIRYKAKEEEDSINKLSCVNCFNTFSKHQI